MYLPSLNNYKPSGNYVLGRVITISDSRYLIKIINFIDMQYKKKTIRVSFREFRGVFSSDHIITVGSGTIWRQCTLSQVSNFRLG